MPDLRHPPGTFDVMPADSAPWERLIAEFARVVEAAGYGLIITPTFEDLAVFERVGASTDVVRKQMYDFEDKGGRRVALRPEMTAAIARAFIQHRPPTPWKAWCVGSAFRYERPQAGRYREFHQVDIEAFGSADPDIDVEVIALGSEFYDAIGLTHRELLLNTLGDSLCRPGYRDLLLRYFQDHRDELCQEHQARLEENPLRVLDCKRPECEEVVAGAPRQIDHLCEPCTRHFARVTEGLEALQIPYTIDSKLVRGLDYYTRTTFEYISRGLETAQNAVGGGGRYDGLVQELGGPDTPAVGFALGIDRILLAGETGEMAESPVLRARPRRLRGGLRGRGGRPRPDRHAAGRRAAGRQGFRRPVAESPVQGGRPVRRPSGRGRRSRRGRSLHRRRQGPHRRRRPGHRAPRPTW